MNRSDYEAMNRIELRDYLRKNRTDELAWDVFMNKNDASPSKSPLYDAPKSLEDFQQFLENNPEVKAKLGE